MNRLWEKAQQAATSARTLLKQGDAEGACSRAYYAMFHAARALLSERGVDVSAIKTHRGLTTLFSRHIVGSKLVDAEVAALLRRGGEARFVADYDTSEIEIGVARQTIRDMDRLLAAIESALDESK